MNVSMLRPRVSVGGRTIATVQRNSVRSGQRGVSVTYVGGGRDWFPDGADVIVSGAYRETFPAGPITSAADAEPTRKVRVSVERTPGADYITKVTANMGAWDK